MNQDPTSQWSAMVSNPEDDFASFLDFGDLNFSAFADTVPTTQSGSSAIPQNGGTTMGSPSEGSSALSRVEDQGQMSQTMSQMPLMDFCQEPIPTGPNAYYTQRHDVARLQQQRWHPQNMVPPTPDSMELHAGRMQHYHTSMDPQVLQQQHMYEQLRRQQEEQMNFTPLISPAVTPLETQYRYTDAPLEPFSPLTSPALQAQNQISHSSIYSSIRGSDTSNTTSPIDLNLDYPAPPSTSTPGSMRRSRRKTSSSSAKVPARAPKRSPAMKPQSKKKQPTSAVIPAKEIAGVLEQASKKQTASNMSAVADGQSSLTHNYESSGADSVSPESLSEILMPPPATPRSKSASKSPYLNGVQVDSQLHIDQNGEPATPASLMRIRKQAGKAGKQRQEAGRLKKQVSIAEADMEQIIEDIILPEPAVNENKKPALQSIDTAQANRDHGTPNGSTGLNIRSGPVSAPVTATGSSFPSPAISTITSPRAVGIGKQSDSRAKGNASKKRGNLNSEKASPALRPRISPGIKPLLPEGGCDLAAVSAETSALLLASKSNYQNILEGTHFPGVSYPENLSTNLTSKRTSHKIAEQGRRNRINTALQEIASLLPPTTPQTQPNGKVAVAMEENERAAAMMTGSSQQQSNSKASTVEAAIDYIKTLQKEVDDCKQKLAEYESEKPHGVQSDEIDEFRRNDTKINGNASSTAVAT
ncbi:uncharacterized protein KY384_008266 [Bacidia gigantensis]|uniref:uncharacterized protein n=1 Tax=Bacidia gigantensis TaxID=2732470 RepID=UPI001D036821|nr:uncharacterized protein KY384_008266 [Bacidia gigantensis]KAG8526837.1 hypothetical protein KY384_008266 [Bacidia gigantensis]